MGNLINSAVVIAAHMMILGTVGGNCLAIRVSKSIAVLLVVACSINRAIKNGSEPVKV